VKVRGIKVSTPLRVFAVGLSKEQAQVWKLIAAYETARTCTKCKRDKGSVSERCPYCNASNVKSGKVKVVTLLKERVGARHMSSTRPGLVHTVYVAGGKFLRCTCESWRYRRYCKHQTMYLNRKRKKR
jgi:hypothetical protein